MQKRKVPKDKERTQAEVVGHAKSSIGVLFLWLITALSNESTFQIRSLSVQGAKAGVGCSWALCGREGTARGRLQVARAKCAARLAEADSAPLWRRAWRWEVDKSVVDSARSEWDAHFVPHARVISSNQRSRSDSCHFPRSSNSCDARDMHVNSRRMRAVCEAGMQRGQFIGC